MLRAKLMTVVAVAGFSLSAHAKDLATVDGKPFTDAMYKEALNNLGPNAEMVKTNPQIRVQFLDHLINSQLLAKEAKNQKIDQSAKYKEAMDAASREILAKIYLEEAIDKQANDKKLKEYFEKNKAQFSDKQVRASHILLKPEDEATAKKALEEAKKKGADFGALAKKYSIDPSKDRDGDLNFFGRGRMVPEFEDVAFKMKKGEIYPSLVKSQFGWHIIKVTDIKGDDNAKFDAKKDQVAAMVKRQMREDLMKDLRNKAAVKVDEKAVGELKL